MIWLLRNQCRERNWGISAQEDFCPADLGRHWAETWGPPSELTPNHGLLVGKLRVWGNSGCQAQPYSGTPLQNWSHNTNKGK